VGTGGRFGVLAVVEDDLEKPVLRRVFILVPKKFRRTTAVPIAI